jgi:hypothetical protein
VNRTDVVPAALAHPRVAANVVKAKSKIKVIADSVDLLHMFALFLKLDNCRVDTSFLPPL